MIERLHRINKRDWILIVGIVLSPMTGLRIGKIGPAEMLCLIWCLPFLTEVLKADIRDYKFTFWISFIYVIILGTLYGSTFYPKETSISGVITYIFFAWIFFSIFIGLSKKSYEEIDDLFIVLCVVITLWYIFLYSYSNYNNSFLGAPLWYGGRHRFSGGGTNPHQLSVCIAAATFGNARSFLKTNERSLEKFVYAVCVLICLFIACETKSSTLEASIVITFFLGFFLSLFSRITDKRLRNKMIYITFSICTFIIIISHKIIYNVFMQWLSDDENGIGRLEIFKTFPHTFRKNALVGLGPGLHAYDGNFEYHNTYLEILAMSGIIGFLFFTIFSIKVFRKLSNELMLMLCIIPLYVYGFAGFAMRRLVYWSILAVVLVLAEKSEINKKDMKGTNDV